MAKKSKHSEKSKSSCEKAGKSWVNRASGPYCRKARLLGARKRWLNARAAGANCSFAQYKRGECGAIKAKVIDSGMNQRARRSIPKGKAV